jgi:hypothetical protein
MSNLGKSSQFWSLISSTPGRALFGQTALQVVRDSGFVIIIYVSVSWQISPQCQYRAGTAPRRQAQEAGVQTLPMLES